MLVRYEDFGLSNVPKNARDLGGSPLVKGELYVVTGIYVGRSKHDDRTVFCRIGYNGTPQSQYLYPLQLFTIVDNKVPDDWHVFYDTTDQDPSMAITFADTEGAEADFESGGKYLSEHLERYEIGHSLILLQHMESHQDCMYKKDPDNSHAYEFENIGRFAPVLELLKSIKDFVEKKVATQEVKNFTVQCASSEAFVLYPDALQQVIYKINDIDDATTKDAALDYARQIEDVLGRLAQE